MDSIKQGDTIPIAGQVTVIENGIDVTLDQDFSLWSITFEFKQTRSAWSYDTGMTLNLDGTFAHNVSSATTLGIEADSTIYYDMRIRDQDGIVVSSRTQEIFVADAASGVP